MSGTLDTASLLAFVGSGDGFVTTVYDQTGNAQHLIQATASAQPKIVSAGSYLGKMVWDGASSGMKIAALSFGTPFIGIYTKAAMIGTPVQYAMFFEMGTDFTSANGQVASYYAPEAGYDWTMQSKSPANGGVQRFIMTPPWTSSLTQTTLLYNTDLSSPNEQVWYASGTLLPYGVGDVQEQSGNYISGRDFYVGCRAGSTLFAPLHLETFVIYNADSSGARSAIETIVS